MPSPLHPFHPLQLTAGLCVWAAWFTVIYGGMSVACSVTSPPPEQGPFTWLNLVMLLFTLATGLFLLFWAYRCWKAVKRLESGGRSDQGTETLSNRGYPLKHIGLLAFGANLLAGLSTLLVGAPILVLSPCLR